MNYLFYSKKKKDKFLKEFNRIKTAIENGVTPVFSELRGVKTTLFEFIPHLIIQSILLVLGVLILNSIKVDETLMLVIVLVVNTTTGTLSTCLLVLLKHCLRLNCLKRFGLEINERNISVLECMEYQSV